MMMFTDMPPALNKEPFLPPGYRFHPTDEELIIYYLMKKVADATFHVSAIGEVDLNKCEPWDLPGKATMGEKEWYFFSLRDRKYPTGLRTNRATEAGYWKATGKDREVVAARSGNLVGMKKTLVFYKGRAPKGEKTSWIMHEYRLEGDQIPLLHFSRICKDEWVVCRVFKKNIGGKKVGTDDRTFLTDAQSSLPPLLESPHTTGVEERTSGSVTGCAADCNLHPKQAYNSLQSGNQSANGVGLWINRGSSTDNLSVGSLDILRNTHFPCAFQVPGLHQSLAPFSASALNLLSVSLTAPVLPEQYFKSGKSYCKSEPYVGDESGSAKLTSGQNPYVNAWDIRDQQPLFPINDAANQVVSCVPGIINAEAACGEIQNVASVFGRLSKYAADHHSMSANDQMDNLWAY